jgi:hypothetical protein
LGQLRLIVDQNRSDLNGWGHRSTFMTCGVI